MTCRHDRSCYVANSVVHTVMSSREGFILIIDKLPQTGNGGPDALKLKVLTLASSLLCFTSNNVIRTVTLILELRYLNLRTRSI